MELRLYDPDTRESYPVDTGLLRLLGFEPSAVSELYRDMAKRAIEIGKFMRFYLPRQDYAELEILEEVISELEHAPGADSAEAN